MLSLSGCVRLVYVCSALCQNPEYDDQGGCWCLVGCVAMWICRVLYEAYGIIWVSAGMSPIYGLLYAGPGLH